MTSSTSANVGAQAAPPAPDATTAPVRPENMISARRSSSAAGTCPGACSGAAWGCPRSSTWSAPARAARQNEHGMFRNDAWAPNSSQQIRHARKGIGQGRLTLVVACARRR
eukprot:2715773-Prymnesium_polylepis.1